MAVARLPFQLQYRALVLHRTSASFMQPEIDRLFTESPQSSLTKLHAARSHFSSASEWTRPAREPVTGFFYSFDSAAFWLWVDFCEMDTSVWKPVLFYVFAQCTQAWLGVLGSCSKYWRFLIMICNLRGEKVGWLTHVCSAAIWRECQGAFQLMHNAFWKCVNAARSEVTTTTFSHLALQ